MGAGATAYATMRAIREAEPRPELIILAGIAGALPGSQLDTGETVLVASERQADLGAWRPETGLWEAFTDREEAQRLECPYVKKLGLENLFPIVTSRSVNTACTPFPPEADDAIENMEGAAFFDVCLKEKVPFLEIRAISNRVGDNRNAWRIGEALTSLEEGLSHLFERIAYHP